MWFFSDILLFFYHTYEFDIQTFRFEEIETFLFDSAKTLKVRQDIASFYRIFCFSDNIIIPIPDNLMELCKINIIVR